MSDIGVQVRCVISGFDIHINYAKVAKAVSYLRTPGCLFVSTNTDAARSCAGDCLLPGNVISNVAGCHFDLCRSVLFTASLC